MAYIISYIYYNLSPDDFKALTECIFQYADEVKRSTPNVQSTTDGQPESPTINCNWIEEAYAKNEEIEKEKRIEESLFRDLLAQIKRKQIYDHIEVSSLIKQCVQSHDVELRIPSDNFRIPEKLREFSIEYINETMIEYVNIIKSAFSWTVSSIIQCFERLNENLSKRILCDLIHINTISANVNKTQFTIYMISLIPEKYKKFYNSNITDTLLEPDYNQLVLYIVILYDTDGLAKLFAYVINSSRDTAIPEFLDKLPIYLMTNNVANILCTIDSENLSIHPITGEQYDNERDVMNYCTDNSDIFTQRA